jgi:hypothetical protein
MKFMSVREFRLNTGQARKGLQVDGELVLTTNGRPFAIVSAVQPETFDRELLALRRSRARVAIDRLREHARADGTDQLSLETIHAVVRDVRRKKVAT